MREDPVQERILIVEDEEDLARGLALNLGKEGYGVLRAASGEEAVTVARREDPDLVLLDVMLPGMNGLDVCQELRRGGCDAPIVMLTAKSDVIDRVVGLEVGADDYIVKPFSLPELLARIRARLRRPSRQAAPGPRRHTSGELEIDFERLRVTRDGGPLSLTSTEFDLLGLLVRHRGEVVSRARMLEEVWGYDPETTTRTVDTHILKLRQKIERDPARPQHILTVYGKGYRFVD